MSLYLRGEIYYALLYHDGQRFRESLETTDKRTAQKRHDALKAELWNRPKQSAKPVATSYAWDDAALAWLEKSRDKRSIEDDKDKLRWLHPILTGIPLNQIDTANVRLIAKKKLSEGVANATVNRHLAVLSAVLHYAHDGGHISGLPKIEMLPEPKTRIRWLTRAEADRLLAELPPHLNAMARFALATGLRRANVTGLEWSQVDLVRRLTWVNPDDAKAAKAINVQLSDEAVAVLKEQIGNDRRWVFVFKGKPVKRATTKAFKKACARAGIEDFTWHDFRHTWASWHVQNGTPLQVLMELGGWSRLEMVLKYAHLAPDHLAQYANNSRPVDTGVEISTATPNSHTLLG